MRMVITGSNRGIGFELARQCLKRGDEVWAAVRNVPNATALTELAAAYPGKLHVMACDVSSGENVRRFAAKLSSPVDALINNAGVMGEHADLESADLDKALEVLSINSLGPLRVTQALLPQLRAGQGKRVLNITSGMGSIGDNRSGGSYAYRMSKAALNMATRNLAIELGPEGIVCAVINPGWVQTEMGGQGAPTSVETSVRGILHQLDQMTPASSGAFLDFDGKQWPW